MLLLWRLVDRKNSHAVFVNSVHTYTLMCFNNLFTFLYLISVLSFCLQTFKIVLFVHNNFNIHNVTKNLITDKRSNRQKNLQCRLKLFCSQKYLLDCILLYSILKGMRIQFDGIIKDFNLVLRYF